MLWNITQYVCVCVCVCKLLSCELEFVSMDFQKSEMTGTLAHMTLFLDKMSTLSSMHLLKWIQTYWQNKSKKQKSQFKKKYVLYNRTNTYFEIWTQ